MEGTDLFQVSKNLAIDENTISFETYIISQISELARMWSSTKILLVHA